MNLFVLLAGSMSVHGNDQCAYGMVYNDCGSACSITCRERQMRPCTLQCIPGCYCESPLLWDEHTQTCTTPDDCSIYSGYDTNIVR